MVQNFPGPYEVQIFYTTDGNEHTVRLNVNVVGQVNPGDLPSTITLATKDSLGIGLPAFITNFITALQPLYSNAGTTFDRYVLWSYTALSYEKTFITESPIGLTGSAVGGNIARHQTTHTSRTQEGGIHRLVLLEGISSLENQLTYPNANAVHQALWDVLTGGNSPVLGKDTSYLIAPLRLSGGQNERLFRRDFR